MPQRPSRGTQALRRRCLLRSPKHGPQKQPLTGRWRGLRLVYAQRLNAAAALLRLPSRPTGSSVAYGSSGGRRVPRPPAAPGFASLRASSPGLNGQPRSGWPRFAWRPGYAPTRHGSALGRFPSPSAGASVVLAAPPSLRWRYERSGQGLPPIPGVACAPFPSWAPRADWRWRKTTGAARTSRGPAMAFGSVGHFVITGGAF